MCSQKMYLLSLKYHFRLSGRMEYDHKSQKLANAQNIFYRRMPQDYVIFGLFQT